MLQVVFSTVEFQHKIC